MAWAQVRNSVTIVSSSASPQQSQGATLRHPKSTNQKASQKVQENIVE